MRIALIVFLVMACGCSFDARKKGEEAGGGLASGVKKEFEAWWEAEKPTIVAEAKAVATGIAEKAVEKAETYADMKAREASEKQGRGEPLSPEDKFWLYFAVGSPFLAALAKAGLRYARGESQVSNGSSPPKT